VRLGLALRIPDHGADTVRSASGRRSLTGLPGLPMIPMRVPFLVIMWTCYDCELLTVVCELDSMLFSDMLVDRLSSNRCSVFPLDDAFEGRTRKRSHFTPGHQHCAVGKVRGTIEVMHASL
jgi:hypothetical protein